MTWKRLFRWFLRAALVCLAGLLCAVGVVWYWVWQDHRSGPSLSEEKILAAALGWPVAGDDAAIREEIMRQQSLALALLGNGSREIRYAAERFFRGRAKELDPVTLDAVAAELTDEYSVVRDAMLVLLATSGDPGLHRIGAIYRSGEPIEPALQELVYCHVNNSEIGEELTALLTKVVADESVTDASRCRAAEALGHLERPLEYELPYKQRQKATIDALRELVRMLPEPVGPSLRTALQHVDDEYAYREQWAQVRARRYSRGNGQEFRDLSPDGHEAIAALSDPDDWERVGEAADALAEHGVKEALPELEHVAAKHWYSPVRKSAERAINVLQGKEPLFELDEQGRFKPPLQNLKWFLVEEAEQWRKDPGNTRSYTLPEAVREILSPAREAYLKRFSPHFDQVEYRRPGRLPQRRPGDTLGMVPMYPKCSIDFGGGTLLGYDEGEFGSGTVFYRKDSPPLFFRTSNVSHFVRMPFGVLIIPSFDRDSGPEVATQAPDGSVTVTPFKKRLPQGWGRYQKLANGDLLFKCIGIDVVITTTGELRVAGSDKEVGAP